MASTIDLVSAFASLSDATASFGGGSSQEGSLADGPSAGGGNPTSAMRPCGGNSPGGKGDSKINAKNMTVTPARSVSPSSPRLSLADRIENHTPSTPMKTPSSFEKIEAYLTSPEDNDKKANTGNGSSEHDPRGVEAPPLPDIADWRSALTPEPESGASGCR